MFHATSRSFSSLPQLGSEEGADAHLSAVCYGHLKPMVDFVVALLLLFLVCLPVLILIILVKLTSKGPALYSQVRLGRGERKFRIYKIRTMYDNCELQTGPCWSTPNDPRVTSLGYVLRRCHLDELPQLWNVLRGEMSLVGPRPERPEIVSELVHVVPAYRDRLCVRPGITGLAQVLLPPDEDLVGVRRKVKYDLFYIGQMGPWLDLRIVAATALKLLGFSKEWRYRLVLYTVPGNPAPQSVLPREEAEGTSQVQTI